MKPRISLITNEQDFVAERFRIAENHLISASKIAMLKIQSWKFAMKTPEIGASYLESVEQIIENSFFQFVPSSLVLSEEGFHFAPLEN